MADEAPIFETSRGGLDGVSAKVDGLVAKFNALKQSIGGVFADITRGANQANQALNGLNRAIPAPGGGQQSGVSTGGIHFSQGGSYINPPSTGGSGGTGGGGSYVAVPSTGNATPAQPAMAGGYGVRGAMAKGVLVATTAAGAYATDARRDSYINVDVANRQMMAMSGGAFNSFGFFGNRQNLTGFQNIETAQAAGMGLMNATGTIGTSAGFGAAFGAVRLDALRNGGDPSQAIGATNSFYGGNTGINMLMTSRYLGYDPFKGGVRPSSPQLAQMIAGKVRQQNPGASQESLASIMSPGSRFFATLQAQVGGDMAQEVRSYLLTPADATAASLGKAGMGQADSRAASASLDNNVAKASESAIGKEMEARAKITAKMADEVKAHQGLATAAWGAARALGLLAGPINVITSMVAMSAAKSASSAAASAAAAAAGGGGAGAGAAAVPAAAAGAEGLSATGVGALAVGAVAAAGEMAWAQNRAQNRMKRGDHAGTALYGFESTPIGVGLVTATAGRGLWRRYVEHGGKKKNPGSTNDMAPGAGGAGGGSGSATVATGGGANAQATSGTGGSAIVAQARKYIGVPYRWGGTDRKNGLDCSGLVLVVFQDLGLGSMPHHAADQATMGTPVDSVANAQPGDLVFFGSPIHHVGIYSGGGTMVDAPHSGAKVREESIAGFGTPAAVRRFGAGGAVVSAGKAQQVAGTAAGGDTGMVPTGDSGAGGGTGGGLINTEMGPGGAMESTSTGGGGGGGGGGSRGMSIGPAGTSASSPDAGGSAPAAGGTGAPAGVAIPPWDPSRVKHDWYAPGHQKLSMQQIAAIAKQDGFPHDQIINAVAVALAESTGDTGVVGYNSASSKSRDIGLWQMNDVYNGTQFGGPPELMLDPVANGKAAYKAWLGRGGGTTKGWEDWSSWLKNKTAQANIPKVTAALGNNYAKGAWEIAEDQIATVHRGEMILDSHKAADVRHKAVTGQGVGGAGITIGPIHVYGTSAAEAERFVTMVANELEKKTGLEVLQHG